MAIKNKHKMVLETIAVSHYVEKVSFLCKEMQLSFLIEESAQYFP
jgi:hypothetical protein